MMQICDVCKETKAAYVTSPFASIAEDDNHCAFCGMEIGLSPEEYARQTDEKLKSLLVVDLD